MKADQVRAILLVVILLSIVFVAPSMMSLAIVPGPEGVNVKMYGVQFAEYSNTFWKLGEIGNNEVLESLETDEFFWPAGSAWSKTEIKCVFPDPYNTQFKKTIDETVSAGALWPGSESHIYTTLQVERERPTISEVNIHGDPLGYANPTDIKYIEYHTPRITEGNQITFTKHVIHVVPVDFIVQMSVRGDRWAGWSDTHLWLEIDTVVWRDAFTERQVEWIQAQLDRDPPEGATLSAYSFRGGFPIWGWVGEWDPLVWYDEEEREDQPSQNALDNVRISPSLEGRELTLYTTPSYQYHLDLEAQGDVADPETLQDILVGDIPALPDPDFATTVYTPIYIEKFYPYFEEGGWGPFYQRKEWYPTTYMRVRLLYAIFGEFTYLWTTEQADEWDYEWDMRYSQYTYTEGPWVGLLSGLGSWLTSPFGILSMLLFGGLILMAILVVLNPALLLGLFKLKGSKRR